MFPSDLFGGLHNPLAQASSWGGVPLHWVEKGPLDSHEIPWEKKEMVDRFSRSGLSP